MDSNIVGFFLGRACVSSSFALAIQNLPDATLALGEEGAKTWITRMDTMTAISRFLARPLWGSLIDSKFGRKKSLVLGCLLSGCSRWLYASDVSSAWRYCTFRFINTISLIPVMQASTAFLADACGGRHTEAFIKLNRRMWMFLAVVRIIITSSSASMANKVLEQQHQQQHNKETSTRAASIRVAQGQLFRASVASLLAALSFAIFCKDQVGAFTPTLMASPLQTLRKSFEFFFQSRERLLLIPVLVLQSLPNYMGSITTRHYRETFHWGPVQRAMLTNVDNAAEVLMPLLFSELTSWSPHSYQWAERASAFVQLNTALTPNSMTLYLNPIIDRIALSGPDFNKLLQKVRYLQSEHGVAATAAGEGTLEAAMASVEFPVDVLSPYLFHYLSEWTGLRAPFLLVSLLTCLNSERLFPRAQEGIMKGGHK